MTMRALATAVLVAMFSGPLLSQSTDVAPTFQAADVHVGTPQRYPFFEPFGIHGDHYELNDATMLDLVSTAYGVDAANVQGGPPWLERNRFDIGAKLPAGTSKEAAKLMLQALLAERFKLVVHTGSKPMPAYVLSVDKAGSKLKPTADDAASAGCDFKPQTPAPDTPNYIVFACHNLKLADFADDIHQWAGGYLSNPVVDQTDLKGGYDFTIKWSNRPDLAKQGADGITIFDAVEKQLGLKLDLLTAPRPVIVVDSVNDEPSPNAPGLDKLMPPQPPRTLEVATIKHATPGGHENWRITPDEVNLQGVSMRELIVLAWDLSPADKEVPVNAPKWLDSEKFDIHAKISNDSGLKNPPLVPFSRVRELLRELLTERFQMKTHMEEIPIDSYKLVAVNPRLKKADPTARTVCKEGPGADGKDPRTANPILGRLITCTDMSMPQFADELQRVANGYVYSPVLDSTGLKGSWDFTLSFSAVQQLGTSTDSAATGAPSTPNGAVPLLDAITKQLGLKLEKDKRPISVLVIDHIEEKPTEN